MIVLDLMIALRTLMLK